MVAAVNLEEEVWPLGTKAKLMLECEAIKQNKSVKEKERKYDNHNNNNFKKSKFGNSAARGPKNECGGLNRTHVMSKFFFLKQQNLADPMLG
jgi:hypothetical protein